MQTELEIRQINTDAGTQARANMDMDTVIEYADAIVVNDRAWPFPPITVFFDGAAYWLADGYHRVAAARRMTYAHPVPADVREGSRRDAILYAAGANADHGLKRTAADKRSAVLILLRDAEWGKWSDRELARACRVSHTFVANVRREVVGVVSGNVATEDNEEGGVGEAAPEERIYTTKHGTEATIIYYPVHALQTAVADWLRQQGDGRHPAQAALINSMRVTGYPHSRWDSLIAALPTPHRENDVKQAVKNVADIWRQMVEEAGHEADKTIAAVNELRNRGYRVRPVPETNRWSIDASNPVSAADMQAFLADVLKEEAARKPTKESGDETRRATWIGVARSMIPICQDYAKTRDYVPDGDGQNHADFDLLAHLRDEYGAQNDLTTMQKRLRQMSLDEIKETLRHYADYADDARANVSRWLNQQAGRGATLTATLDAIDAQLDADYAHVLAVLDEPEPTPTAVLSDDDAYLLTAVRPVALALPKLSSRQRNQAADYLKNMSSDEPAEIAALFRSLSTFVRDWRNEA